MVAGISQFGRWGVVVACLTLGAWLSSPAPAQAQILGGGFGAGGFNGGLGLGFFNYGAGSYQRPPYFAMFPPVYYSYAVPRPYGYSPFAYPPGVTTPEVLQPSGAAEYRNPFTPGKGEAPVSSDKTASVARTYFNPFVGRTSTQPNDSVAQTPAN